MNEPNGTLKANVSYVENHTVDNRDWPRVEYWTNQPVKKGAELMAHYGGEYERQYAQPSPANQGGYQLRWQIRGGTRRKVRVPEDGWEGSP